MVNPNNKQRRQVKQRVPVALVRDICAVTDPFCSHAVGAKSPHGSKVVTVPIRMKGIIQMTTSAGGEATMIFSPRVAVHTYYSAAAGAVPAVSAFDQSTGAFPSFVSEARVVSSGIRWWNVLPATAGGGSVVAFPLTDTDTILTDGASTAEMTNITGSHISDIREPGEFTFSPVEVTSRDFIVPSTGAIGTTSNSGWDSVGLTITAGASSVALNVEYVIHYECTIDSVSGNSLGQPSPARPVLIAAQELMNSIAVRTGTRETIHRMIKDKAYGVAKRLLSSGASAAANYLLPGSGYAVQALTNGVPDID
jgi:hypothetical protein